MYKYLYCSGIFGLLWDIYNPTNVCVKDVDSWASMVFRNYQNFIELTSNMIYCVALGIGLKLGQWTPGPKSSDRPEAGLILLGLHSLEWAFHWVSLSILLGPLKTGFPSLGQALYFFCESGKTLLSSPIRRFLNKKQDTTGQCQFIRYCTGCFNSLWQTLKTTEAN